MSNIRDSLSERGMNLNRPSSSCQPPIQPFKSKNSLHNNLRENKNSTSCKTQKNSSVPKLKQPQSENKSVSRSDLNSSISELSTQCESLNITTETNEVNQEDSPARSKKKNAKKKEKLNQLKRSQGHGLEPSQNTLLHSSPITQDGISTIQEHYMTQISHLYATTSTRYLENLKHHPQYQYIQSCQEIIQNKQYSIRTPTTPVVQSVQNGYSLNMPNSAVLKTVTSSYLVNINQHPLLAQSLLKTQQEAVSNFSQVKRNLTESHTRQNKRVIDVEFEPYWLKEQVELGLEKKILLEGVLRINPKQFKHSYVSSNDRNEQDVLIDGIKNRNRALEGDIVVVQLIEDSDDEDSVQDEKQKKGKVVFIKEKIHNRNCIGTLKPMPDNNRQRALFVPRDHRIPRLNIPFTCWPDNFSNDAKSYENTLFLAKILEWPDTRFAIGKIVSNIGQCGDILTESKAILEQTGLDITPFGSEVRHLFPRLDYVIPDEEIQSREDCRKLCIFSIDPLNCRDIDDAISCVELDDGNYEIGVHISDVAHFLAENTLLDEKVADKATTIYMVEKAYHMLPDELCMLCSLFPGVDKLAFSIFWVITPDAKVLSHRFSKTVVHSCCQLAYEHAQAIIENRDDAESTFPETYNGYGYKEIYKVITLLAKISATFRTNRFENGALKIDQPKVSFHLNALNGLPENYCIYESKQSHQLIEEFMLLANMTVAARIHEDHPEIALLRSHPPPSGYMLQQLAKSLKPMGIELEIATAGDLHRSLLPYVNSDNQDKGRAMVLSMLCAKPMSRAKYFCAGNTDDADFHHYALNVPLYTHFTSPIRRYADIMVHRLLAASLNYRKKPKWEIEKVRMVAAQCNKQKYNAKKAYELSTELYLLKYIQLHSPILTHAVVVEVKEHYIDVIVVAMGLNQRIFLKKEFPGKYEFIKNDGGTKLSKMILTWQATDEVPEAVQVIDVFSILQVEMSKGDEIVKVEVKLIRPL